MFLKKKEDDMADTKELLNTAVAGLIDRLEKTEKFVLEQAPDVCQQVVAEFKLQVYVQMCLGVAATILGIIALSVAYHNGIMSNPRDYHPDGEPTWWFLLFLLGLAGAIIGPWVTLNAVYWNVYVQRCTKLFLLRQFRKLVK